MTKAFDDRLIKLGIAIDGKTITYDQNFYILASGTKYTDGTLGDCAVRIDNISKATRDELVTKTSPFVPDRKLVTMSLDVGRASTGLFRLYEGQAIAGNPTQPPDIGLYLRALSMSFNLGNIIKSTLPPTSKLSEISQRIADDNGLTLDFQATDRGVVNYVFNGASIKQVEKLNALGNIHAFVDNKKLIVVDALTPLKGETIKINRDTGMIGVPQVTELGISVDCLISGEIKVGSEIEVKSELNKAANGKFLIYKLGFEISSWETPFYWKIEARRFSIATK